MADYLYLIIALAIVLVGALAGLVTSRVRGRSRTTVSYTHLTLPTN